MVRGAARFERGLERFEVQRSRDTRQGMEHTFKSLEEGPGLKGTTPHVSQSGLVDDVHNTYQPRVFPQPAMGESAKQH
jgi:hypothetical protein